MYFSIPDCQNLREQGHQRLTFIVVKFIAKTIRLASFSLYYYSFFSTFYTFKCAHNNTAIFFSAFVTSFVPFPSCMSILPTQHFCLSFFWIYFWLLRFLNSNNYREDRKVGGERVGGWHTGKGSAYRSCATPSELCGTWLSQNLIDFLCVEIRCYERVCFSILAASVCQTHYDLLPPRSERMERNK